MTSLQGLMNSVDYVVNGVWTEYEDSSMSYLPLIGKRPWKVVGLVAVYLWWVLWKGPRMMKNREPYDLKRVILVYNIILVVLHVPLFVIAIWATDLGLTCWKCEKADFVNPSNLQKTQVIALLGYAYFLSNFLEFSDTIFFILRKKTSQVTRLHVFHLAVMPTFCWCAARFSVWHPTAFVYICNSFVHIIMYGYYTMALLEIKRFLWLKKYITQLQLLQFLMMICHAVYFLQHKTSFYYNTYIKKRVETKKID